LDFRRPFYRALVVGLGDDDREFVSLHLKAADVLVETADSSAHVLDRIDGEVPDLIIVDGTAHRGSGLDLCRQIKGQPHTASIPVIQLADSAAGRIDSLAAGIDEFFTRDVSGEEFTVRVTALLKGRVSKQALAAQLASEIRRSEKIRDVFSRYVSPSLVDQILGEPSLRQSVLADRSTRVRAAVLFADMRGFTRISEQLPPTEVVPLLNEYFDLLTEIAFKHDGTIFNMTGDCLMVGFGVPIEQPDTSVRAVETAREMLIRFRELVANWKRRHEIETGLGIGINEGEVIAGNVGSPAYMSYTIIGDTVNVASRLAQRARAGEMLFSEEFKRSLDVAGFDAGAIELPPLVLRGRAAPVNIYCVPVGERLDIRDR
jgi:adenylate cyclase